MSAKNKTLLQRMDALVWWSNASDILRHDMSGNSFERRHLPKRWLPLLPMILAAGLILATTALPGSHMLYYVGSPIMLVGTGIAINGPLGKSSINDDEREAALRKDAFFFCMAFLAVANVLGGPILLLTAALRGWTVEHSVGAAFALFVANMTCFVSLPTLYASWKIPKMFEGES